MRRILIPVRIANRSNEGIRLKIVMGSHRIMEALGTLLQVSMRKHYSDTISAHVHGLFLHPLS